MSSNFEHRSFWQNGKMAYANSADPDQTATGAVWSGSTLFAFPLSILKAPYSSKIEILLSKKDLINWYVVLIQL